VVLGVQLELVQVLVAPVAPPPVGVLAADRLGAHGRAPAARVGVARVRVADRAVDLEEAAHERFEERRAGCNDAEVELEAASTNRVSIRCLVWLPRVRFQTYFCQK